MKLIIKILYKIIEIIFDIIFCIQSIFIGLYLRRKYADVIKALRNDDIESYCRCMEKVICEIDSIMDNSITWKLYCKITDFYYAL